MTENTPSVISAFFDKTPPSNVPSNVPEQLDKTMHPEHVQLLNNMKDISTAIQNAKWKCNHPFAFLGWSHAKMEECYKARAEVIDTMNKTAIHLNVIDPTKTPVYSNSNNNN